jgi:hypothetical protein
VEGSLLDAYSQIEINAKTKTPIKVFMVPLQRRNEAGSVKKPAKNGRFIAKKCETRWLQNGRTALGGSRKNALISD